MSRNSVADCSIPACFPGYINQRSHPSNTLHFPGFAEDTCQFLVTERDIAGIGVDTISLDIGPSKEFKAHKALLRGNKWGLECVANLSRIPPSGATVFVGATKVEGSSGGPARLIACWA